MTGVFLVVFIIFAVVIWVGIFVGMIMKRRRTKRADTRFGKDEFLFVERFPYLVGLDLPENAICNVYCLRNRIVIEALKHEYSLPVKKIVDVSIMSKTDVQKQYVSDAGGAVAGGMVLGPLGAALWGGVKERTIANTSHFLIFTYRSADNEDLKYIIFDATDRTSKAKNFTDAFKPLKRRQNIKIDL